MQPGVRQAGLGGYPGGGENLQALPDREPPGQAGQRRLADARVADHDQRAAVLCDTRDEIPDHPLLAFTPQEHAVPAVPHARVALIGVLSPV